VLIPILIGGLKYPPLLKTREACTLNKPPRITERFIPPHIFGDDRTFGDIPAKKIVYTLYAYKSTRMLQWAITVTTTSIFSAHVFRSAFIRLTILAAKLHLVSKLDHGHQNIHTRDYVTCISMIHLSLIHLLNHFGRYATCLVSKLDHGHPNINTRDYVTCISKVRFTYRSFIRLTILATTLHL